MTDDLVKRARDCANGIGSPKNSRGDLGLFDDLAARIEALEAEVARLKSELRWYANRANWDSYPTTLNKTVSPARLDGGKRARAALQDKEGE